MKILDNGTVRDMTEEEEQRFLESVKNAEATEFDYIDALNALGVDTNAEN